MGCATTRKVPHSGTAASRMVMREGSDPSAPALAVVIPVFDEEESLRPLHRELDAALGGIEGGVEILFVGPCEALYRRTVEAHPAR